MQVFRRRVVWGFFLLLFTLFLSSWPVLAHHSYLARTGERWSREELELRLSLLRGDVADLSRLREEALVEAADAVTYGLERMWFHLAPFLAERGERGLASELEKEMERLHEAVHTENKQAILSARAALLPLLDRAAEVMGGSWLERVKEHLGLFFLSLLAWIYALAATAAALVFYRRYRRVGEGRSR